MRTRLNKRAIPAMIVISLLASCGKEKNTGPANAGDVDPAVARSVDNGKSIYQKYCLTCHLANGQGAAPMNPPLAKTSFVTGDKPTLINIVLKGMSNIPVDGEKYRNVMPPFDYLTDKEIADLLTYVRESFGNGGEPVNESEVKEVRSQHQ